MPNGHKIDQMAINVPTSSIARPSKIYPERDFWFKKKPSGNPGREDGSQFLETSRRRFCIRGKMKQDNDAQNRFATSDGRKGGGIFYGRHLPRIDSDVLIKENGKTLAGGLHGASPTITPALQNFSTPRVA
jgi:hypothetical protein